MKKETEFTCIVCPNGCPLQVKWEEGSADFTVSGNRCPRGREFAVSEMTAPKRTICSTVRTVFEGVPVLPVRLSAEIPRKRIFDVMEQIRRACVTKPVERGSVVAVSYTHLLPSYSAESERFRMQLCSLSRNAQASRPSIWTWWN